MTYGGSLIRPEATGFGAVYFLRQMLEKAGMDIKGQTIAISGFGNVAGARRRRLRSWAPRCDDFGPRRLHLRSAGLDSRKDRLHARTARVEQRRGGPLRQDRFAGSTILRGQASRGKSKVDIAMPCATQNELDGEDAGKLLANGVKVVAEVSNMGCRPEAIDAFIAARFPTGRARRSMPAASPRRDWR